MLPHNISGHQLRLPPGDRHSAVLFTGSGLRHLRLGYQLQQKFPGFLKKWWCGRTLPGEKYIPPKTFSETMPLSPMLSRGKWAQAKKKLRKLISRSTWAHGQENTSIKRSEIERHMFESEVRELKLHAHLHPEPLDDRNTDEVLHKVRSIQPYFLLALGGALIKKPLLDSVRGLAINQHAGWSPDLKGSKTIETALYHRRIDQVGSTVHLMVTAADAGPILRRSTVTLSPDDTPQDCFMAAVALGTELMLEVLSQALTAQSLWIFDQPASGKTFRSADFSSEKNKALQQDFRKGWLKEAIRMETIF